MTTSDDAKAAATAAAAAAEVAAQAQAAAAAAQQRADELAAQVAVTEDADLEHADAVRSDVVDVVRAGYDFGGPAIEIGALVDGDAAVPEAQVRIPLGMLNRHGLIAGATGTGKTKTLQVLAEQVSAHGVPVFAADIKGDLSGIATPGAASDKLAARCESIGQAWTPQASPTEFFTLGGMGTGVPIRASIESFGPTLLSKVLGLNDTQESSLGLIFHYARNADLDLIDLADLRAVVLHLTSDEGKAELKELGGLSSATLGVILRELIAFADEGADVFFGQPEIDVADFLRTNADGTRGIVSLLEVPGVQEKPALFSTFLMYLLQQLFRTLPEVGDTEKPTLVFFFDEAHLLFRDASKDFMETITQTVRLIRSKGVGVVFVTQTPKDVPADVLAQLGSRVQHQLRAHTPNDAKALKATVSTYPTSTYDLGEVLQQLAIGEAVVTVMNDKGAPTPVAWTRVRAPQGSMDPTPEAQMQSTVAASPLMGAYGTVVDPESAAEKLGRVAAAADAATAAETQKQWEQEEAQKVAQEAERIGQQRGGSTAKRRSSSRRQSTLDKAVGEASRTFAREMAKKLFGRR